MGRPVRSSPSTIALVFLACATTRFTAGSNTPPPSDTDGSRKTASEPGSTPPPPTTTEFPVDFPTIGVRLIAVSLLVLLILLLLAWIFLSRRIAAVFRRHFIHEPPPDLVQRASWIVEHQDQLLPPPARAGGSNEDDGQEEEKFISTFVTKYQSGQTRKSAEGGKQSLTLFTLRDCAGTSQQDRTGDTRSRAGSEDDFHTPDGSYRGSAFMMPVATSISGSMMSVATWPQMSIPATPPTPPTPVTPVIRATPATQPTGAPTLAVLAAEALAAAAESDSSATDTSTITASDTLTTATSVPPTPSTPTDPSPLTSVSVTPTLSRTRLQLLSPPLSPTLEVRGNATSDPSVDVWLSPQEMSADERTEEDGPCSATIENMQRRSLIARFPSSRSSTYGTTVQLTSDGSVDDWFSTQETTAERTDDERLYSAISEDLCGRLLASSPASSSTLAHGSRFHLLSTDSLEVWLTAQTSPDKTDDDSARCTTPNNDQENGEANRSQESSRPTEDSNVQEPDRQRSNSARKAQP